MPTPLMRERLSPIIFPIHTMGLQDERGQPVGTHIALVNGDTGQQLTIIDRHVKVISIKVLLTMIESMMISLGPLPLYKEDVELHDTVGEHGRYCLRDYKITMKLSDDGSPDYHKLRLLVQFQLGMDRIQLYTGLYDGGRPCLLESASLACRVLTKPRDSIVIESIRPTLDRMMKQFYNHRKRVLVWNNVMIKKEEAEHLIEHMQLSHRISLSLLQRFIAGGRTSLYDLHQVLLFGALNTDQPEFAFWPTTPKTEYPMRLLRREEAVMKLIQSTMWRDIERK